MSSNHLRIIILLPDGQELENPLFSGFGDEPAGKRWLYWLPPGSQLCKRADRQFIPFFNFLQGSWKREISKNFQTAVLYALWMSSSLMKSPWCVRICWTTLIVHCV